MKQLVILVAVITLSSCSMEKKFSVDACPKWADNIHNPENEEFVEEVAFNLHVSADEVTQEQFNIRYNL